MDILQGRPKLTTVLPVPNNTGHINIIKKKSYHKLNISDYINEKQKKLSKKYSQKFDLEDLMNISKKNINENKRRYARRSSYNYNAEIKKELLKDYREQIKKEKKYRKLKVIENLSDSSCDESGEEDKDIGLEIYISSESNFILIFDILIIFFTFYLFLFIPIKLAQRKYYYIEENKIYAIFNIITEVLYILDLFIGFFRTFYNHEYKKITNTNEIIINYLANDFFIDLLEAFPAYIICRNFYYKNTNLNVELSRTEINLTIFQMTKSLKLLKILKTEKNRAIELLSEKVAGEFFFENLFNIFIFLLKIFSFLHILICIHIFLGWQTYPNWMTYIGIANEKLITQYLCSFYFIIETMTTVGYGDIICISFIERVFQLIILSIGIVSYSFIVTKFGNYIMNKSKQKIELDKKILQLEQIRIQYPSMSYKLYINIQKYFLKKSEKNNKKNEMTNLANNLPDKLRNDMLLILNKDVIKKFIVFKECNNTDFIIQMCSSFIYTICEKETILIMEGKKAENIIFVNEGRLILEAAINLSDPSKSYEKYFKENFKYIDLKSYQKMKNSNSHTTSAIDYKQIESSNYLNFLEERLIDKNKIGKNRNSFFDMTRNSVSFQVGYESDEIKENENDEIIKEKINYKYLKILDIRENEHFGDVCLFLDKPSPLTLKVKSKKAQIYILKKKDAQTINNIHHNIMNRIREKSFKNLLSIKNKTFDILNKYLRNKINKIKRTKLENASWFQEKSINNVSNDITNFLNNSIKQISDLSHNSPIELPGRKSMVKDYLKLKTTQKINLDNNKENINDNNPNYIGIRTLNIFNGHSILKNKLDGCKKQEEGEICSTSSKNNLLSLNYEPKIIKKEINKKSLTLKANSKVNNNFHICELSKRSDSNNHKKVSFKLSDQKTKSLSKEIQPSSLGSFSEVSSQLTQKEKKIVNLNDFNSEREYKIRKKIKSYAQKEMILQLFKMQIKMLKSYEKKTTVKSNSSNNSDNNLSKKDINELKKISDLNKIINNKILEYLDMEAETYMEEKFKPEKIISFSIKKSYSNLNNLTRGKIIINNNYKIDIKNLIQNYMKEKHENSFKTIGYLDKKFYADVHDQDQNIYNGEYPDKKKVKFKISLSSKDMKMKIPKDKISTLFLSYQIKKSISNQIKSYNNIKNLFINNSCNESMNAKIHSKFSSKNKENDNSKHSNSGNVLSKFISSIFSKLKWK